MLMTLLTVSGAIFWMIVAGLVVLDIVLLSAGADENENVGIAVFVTVAGLLLSVLFTDAFIGVQLGYVAAGLAAYVVVGVIWSFKKWYTFVVDELASRREEYKSYVNKKAPGNETFESYAKDKQPKAVENKQRIVGWMALWPFSLSWWVLTWPRHAFVWAYNRLSTVFDRISAKIWASAS